MSVNNCYPRGLIMLLLAFAALGLLLGAASYASLPVLLGCAGLVAVWLAVFAARERAAHGRTGERR
jgi:hypothetical protein